MRCHPSTHSRAHDPLQLEKKFDSVRKRLEKLFVTNTALREEVWLTLSEQVAQMFRHYEDLVAQCYGGRRLAVSADEVTRILESTLAVGTAAAGAGGGD